MKKVQIGLGIVILLALYVSSSDLFKKELSPEEKQAQVERVNQTILEGIMESEQDTAINASLEKKYNNCIKIGIGNKESPKEYLARCTKERSDQIQEFYAKKPQ